MSTRTKKQSKSPFPEKFSDRQWTRYVNQGRALVEEETRIQFKLGDITLKMMPKNDNGGDHGVGLFLERYAEEIGTIFDTLRDYRHVAIKWPPEQRVQEIPYSVHRALAPLSSRFEVIKSPPDGAERWTYDAAVRYAGGTPGTPVSPEEKLDRVRSLLNDHEIAAQAVTDQVVHRPEVAEKVMTHQSSRSALYRANLDRLAPPDEPSVRTHREGTANEAHAQHREQKREPLVDDTMASRQVLDLLGMGTSFYTGMQRLIPKLLVSEITDEAKKTIKDNHRRVRAVLDWCDTVIATGEISMDDQLARLLEGDDPR